MENSFRLIVPYERGRGLIPIYNSSTEENQMP